MLGYLLLLSMFKTYHKIKTMKKILTLLITLGLVSSAFAADFTSYQLASTTLTNGYILQTNGKNNKWVATSSLGFPTGGSGTVTSVSALTPTGLTVSSTTCTTNCILNFTLTSGYVIPLSASTTQWNTFYNASNTLVTFNYASSTFPSFSYASSTFAPTANPTFTGTINFTNASGTGITATHYGDFYPVGLSNSFIAVDVTGKIIATTTPAGGSISGGQEGYVTRWLSPTTVGTSTLLDDGVNAGVDATSSLYEFYVKGDTVGSHHPFAVASTSGNINFHIDQNGSVGVGTSTFGSNDLQETLKVDCGSTTLNCIVS